MNVGNFFRYTIGFLFLQMSLGVYLNGAGLGQYLDVFEGRCDALQHVSFCHLSRSTAGGIDSVDALLEVKVGDYARIGVWS